MTATFVVQLMLVSDCRHPKMSTLECHPRQAAGVNPDLNSASTNLVRCSPVRRPANALPGSRLLRGDQIRRPGHPSPAGNLDLSACPKAEPSPTRRRDPCGPGSRAEPKNGPVREMDTSSNGRGERSRLLPKEKRPEERTVGSSHLSPKWQIGHDRQHPPNELTPTRGIGPLEPVPNGLRNAALPKESDAKSFEHGPQ